MRSPMAFARGGARPSIPAGHHHPPPLVGGCVQASSSGPSKGAVLSSGSASDSADARLLVGGGVGEAEHRAATQVEYIISQCARQSPLTELTSKTLRSRS